MMTTPVTVTMTTMRPVMSVTCVMASMVPYNMAYMTMKK